jgi:hypothetical protein
MSKEVPHQIVVDYSVYLHRGCALKCYQKVALVKKLKRVKNCSELLQPLHSNEHRWCSTVHKYKPEAIWLRYHWGSHTV